MQFNLKSTSGSQKPNHPPIEFLPPAPRKNHLPKFSTQIRKLPIRRFRGSIHYDPFTKNGRSIFGEETESDWG